MSTALGIPVDFRRASFTRSRKEKIIMDEKLLEKIARKGLKYYKPGISEEEIQKFIDKTKANIKEKKQKQEKQD